MIKLQSSLNLAELANEVIKLDFSNKYDHRVKMVTTQGGGVLGYGPRVMEAVAEIEQLRGHKALHVNCNLIAAGVYVAPHIDYLPPTTKQGKSPTVERWHLPIITNTEARLSGEYLEPGFWHGYIEYWKSHDVYGGSADRVHLLVDLDTPIRLGEYPNDPRTD